MVFAHFCNQFNHVFVLPIFIPHSKALAFIKVVLKLSYFGKKKYKIFERWGLRPKTAEIASPLQIAGYAAESNHVFALLISMPPEFSLTSRLKSINLYQNKPKSKLFVKKIKFFECWGLSPQTSKHHPTPTADFWLRSGY